MRENPLDHTLTETERLCFEKNGYIIVRSAMPHRQVRLFESLVDFSTHWKNAGPSCTRRVNIHNAIGREPAFLDLIDWPTTFPKVWGILGWHIQLYHTQIIVSPPGAEPKSIADYSWHQDNNRMNKDFETTVQPRVSVKVAYFLTDTTRTGTGNLYVVPGSHHDRTLEWLPGSGGPRSAIPVRVPAGSAVVFDRRLWHAASPNLHSKPRKVLFFGYSYRWLRPKSHVDAAMLNSVADPIRRQLLGHSSSPSAYFDPTDDDLPLKTWIETHVGKEYASTWNHARDERRGSTWCSSAYSSTHPS